MAAAFVQSRGAHSVGSVASFALAFNSNVASGNLLVVGGAAYANGSLGTGAASDSRGNTYTRDAHGQNGTAPEAAVFSAQSGSSGACTVTLDPTGSEYVAIGIAEFSGMATSSPLEAQNTGAGAPSSNTIATGNLVCDEAVAILGIMEHGGSGSVQITEHASYTFIAENLDVTYVTYNCCWKIVPAGTYTASWTIGGAAQPDRVAAAAAYKEAGGGGGETVTMDKWFARQSMPYRPLDVVPYF